MKMQIIKSIWKNLAIFTILFGIDRISKFLILKSSGNYTITSFFSFDIAINRGIAWGFFHSESTIGFLVVTGLILIIICAMFWYAWQQLKAGKIVCEEMLILAGATSNLWDRIVYGGVIDFIHFHIGNWSFPIFNMADIFIVIGVLWIMFAHHEQ